MEWSPEIKIDADLNDSNKTFSVPTDNIWLVQSLFVDLTTTATVGNRRIAYQLEDSLGNILGDMRSFTNQAASLSRKYMAYQSVARGTVDDLIYFELPAVILPENSVIRVFDSAAVDAAADDMIVRLVLLSSFFR